ncbi:MAG: FMN-binding protein [Prevotella sp.]|nr:FMN-binding protein [Prevotella sp.]
MIKKTMLIGAAAVVAATMMMSADNKKAMVKENGAYVVNTTELAKDVIGYEGPTPLKVYIRKNKVEKIEFLQNDETPKYWQAASKHLQNAWDGKTVKEAKELKVDGRTGATYSSDAIKENVKRALDYYEKNK